MMKRTIDCWRMYAAADAGASPVERTWYNSRSLAELKIYLAKEKTVQPTEEQAVSLQKVFLYAAPKPNMQEEFSEMLTELWKKTPDHTWLKAIISNLPEEVAVWSDTENFLAGSKALAAKDLEPWFKATLAAKRVNWLVKYTLGLPLRYWSSIESALAEEEATEELFEAALESLRRGEASPDIVAWLWKKKDPRTEAAFANPQAIFRILSGDVKGEYIKARKDVMKLLMENEGFQRALMDGGSDAGIATFVKTVKNMPMLNRGEQQSLLVKICRLFPEAKAMVENRAVTKRHMPKITSVRMYEAARDELNDIVNKQIPENAQAISTARDYGDLRENFEFKAAQEKQRMLSARRAELERSLKEVQATDFADVSIDKVVVCGCTIDLDVEGKKGQTYHLLGLWDSEPDKKILSYDTPLGKELIGKSTGAKVALPSGKDATIAAIRELPADIKEWVVTPKG